MRKMLMPGLAVLALAAAALFWLLPSGAPGGEAPAQGIVKVTPATPAPAKAATATPVAGGAALPAAPDAVIAHVRAAYPLLTKVDFSCDTAGCAVTATIPPPTDEAFLAKRQEMLLGGLAKVVATDRYQPIGPVQMDEIESNLFHIRLPVTQAKQAP
jgi:hypothetical protein